MIRGDTKDFDSSYDDEILKDKKVEGSNIQ